MTDARTTASNTLAFTNRFLATLVLFISFLQAPQLEANREQGALAVDIMGLTPDFGTILPFLVTGLRRSRRARNLRSLSALKPLLPIGSLP